MPRHLPLVHLAIAAALLTGWLTGCAQEQPPPPQVTFAANGQSAAARPAQYCDLQLTDCQADATAIVRMPVSPGTPVQITVPPEIAQTPWQVVLSYTDPAGDPVDERSPVFGPGERTEWTLTLPDPAAQLITAQVQQYGPPPQQTESGELEFPIRASWVLQP